MLVRALLLATCLCSPTFAAAQDRPDPKALAAEERALLKERYDLAKDYHQQVMDVYSFGKLSFEEVVVATRRLAQAEYDLATTPAARLAALQKGVENAQANVDFEQQRVEGGGGTTLSLNAAKYALADAKLLAVRERQRQATPAARR
jgi:hypothetical protein